MHVTAVFCTLHSHRPPQTITYTTRGGALQVGFTRHLCRHARPLHCTRLSRMHRRPPRLSSDKRATTAAAPVAVCFSRAAHVNVQRAVDDEVELDCTSTPELVCDAGTPGTLTAQAFWAGSKGWHTFCAHALPPRPSDGDLQILRPMYLSCSARLELSAAK